MLKKIDKRGLANCVWRLVGMHPERSTPFALRLTLLLLLCVNHLFAQKSTRLINDWEFVKQDLGGAWEAVRPVKAGNPEELPFWQKVSLPHCFNATDAVDPDVNYYQGPGWYRTNLEIQNPYANGRTLLHFEGAGQKTTVYIYNTKVAEHVGGYDEWSVDITKAVEEFKKLPVLNRSLKGKFQLYSL
jgi:beta-galactosidase